MRFAGSLAVVFALTSCTSSTDPKVPGAADVFGSVLQASGSPLTGRIVAISCPDGQILRKVTTDSDGRYETSLAISAAIMASTGGHVTCEFGAPDSVNARIHAQAVVNFFPDGLPHPLQIVNLKEGQ
jgi:hypothetical protein